GGLGEAAASLAVTAYAFGNVVLPVPLGMAADRLGPRRVLAACALASAGALLLVPVALASVPLFLLAVFLFGGASIGLYVVGLAALMARLGPADTAPANAAFVSAYGLGALVGPLLAGGAMDLWDPHGLVAVFLLPIAAYGLVLARRRD
ncbi:MAG: MFS transporter, partial [Alphaproteobacteria bacterium]|nr:MFS transporter [Alphaproteobacteria bacterium]